VMKPWNFCYVQRSHTRWHVTNTLKSPLSSQGTSMGMQHTHHCYRHHLSFITPTNDVRTDASHQLHVVQQDIDPTVSSSHHNHLLPLCVRVPRYLHHISSPLHHKTCQQLDIHWCMFATSSHSKCPDGQMDALDTFCRLRVAKWHINSGTEQTRTRICCLPPCSSTCRRQSTRHVCTWRLMCRSTHTWLLHLLPSLPRSTLPGQQEHCIKVKTHTSLQDPLQSALENDICPLSMMRLK
jgi:hypothetical protein